MAPGTAATLAERIRQGDATAEEELVEAYRGRVFAMAMARMRDREASRDIVQEVLWAVVRALRHGQVREPHKLAAFVCGTTRNVISNYRRSQPANRVDTPVTDDMVRAQASHDRQEDERVALVRRAMIGLDADDRRIVSLTLFEGLKSGEIAVRLRLHPDVIRQRKVRAIRRVIGILRDGAGA
jgi:RNA polymerase sigma-70 factor (ECF subfamily)